VSWTLYAGFAYILAFLILALVTGYRNWGVVEYTVIAGGPPVYVSPMMEIEAMILTLPTASTLVAER
jgi:hypothetical protein